MSDRLACDDCGMPDALPWIAFGVGMALTAGWVALTAYSVARDVHARHFAGLRFRHALSRKGWIFWGGCGNVDGS